MFLKFTFLTAYTVKNKQKTNKNDQVHCKKKKPATPDKLGDVVAMVTQQEQAC